MDDASKLESQVIPLDKMTPQQQREAALAALAALSQPAIVPQKQMPLTTVVPLSEAPAAMQRAAALTNLLPVQ